MTVTLDTGAAARVASLTPDESMAAEQAARGVMASGAALVDSAGWVDAARTGWSELPLGLRRPLHEFRRDSGRSGVLLLRGLPVDEAALPDTPSGAGSVQRAGSVSAAMLTMVACGLGDPAAFRPEKTGALVQDVVPVPGKEEFQGNAGSVLLTFHNENAFHPHRPDFVMLLCLRADHEKVAALRTAGIRAAMPLLSEETRAALAAPEFVTAPPPSFGGSDGGTAPHPVIFGAPEDPDLRIDFAATEPVTDRARRAMDELGDAFERTGQSTVLAPGDLAIVDNRVTTHGRSAFQPRYDGRDRWLQRTFVLTDLRRSRGSRSGDGYVLD
ncbi:clavaminate synthase family protein [Streptomyces platensis]|uniref:clavaminate synthase family protein n=1 Tax=Streptomyces platensis TaxID=58346 RepID=UPI002250BBF3|nr:clavaminate synthase family protein [Streptomyces platensis]MCX4639677.1 clavaminate synthase family protein [Streptomyces platensis]